MAKIATPTGWDSVSAIPAGGTTSQVLSKKTSTDYDVQWSTAAAGGSNAGLNTSLLATKVWSGSAYVWPGSGVAPDSNAYTNITFIDPTGTHDPKTSTGGRNVANDLWESGTSAGAGQPLDTELTALASTTSAVDKLPYFTGLGTATTTTLTATARALLDDTSNTGMRTTMGVAPIAVKSTTPVAADYNEATIPTGAIWVQI